MLNVIWLAVPGGGGGFTFESRIAWRNEPGPMSLVFVTVKTKTKGDVTSWTPFASSYTELVVPQAWLLSALRSRDCGTALARMA